MLILATSHSAPAVASAIARFEMSMVTAVAFPFCAYFVVRVMFSRGSLINLIEDVVGLASKARTGNVLALLVGLAIANAGSALLAIALTQTPVGP